MSDVPTPKEEDNLPTRRRDIHPSFTKGDIVLQPASGPGFRYRLAKLARHSAFFKDLQDLPRPPGRDANVIPLVNATSEAVHFTLGFIQYLDCQTAPPKHELGRAISLDRCETLGNVLELWDMLLITHIGPLYQWASTHCTAQPEIPYVLSYLTFPAWQRDKAWEELLKQRFAPPEIAANPELLWILRFLGTNHPTESQHLRDLYHD